MEARGFGPNPPVPAPPPYTKGPECVCVGGAGGYPLATAPALAPPGWLLRNLRGEEGLEGGPGPTQK